MFHISEVGWLTFVNPGMVGLYEYLEKYVFAVELEFMRGKRLRKINGNGSVQLD